MADMGYIVSKTNKKVTIGQVFSLDDEDVINVYDDICLAFYSEFFSTVSDKDCFFEVLYEKTDSSDCIVGCFEAYQVTINRKVDIQEVLEKTIASNNQSYIFNFATYFPEYRNILKPYITDSEYAYCWVRDFGDKEYMFNYINTPRAASYWLSNVDTYPETIERFLPIICNHPEHVLSLAIKHNSYQRNAKNLYIQYMKGNYYIKKWLEKWPDDVGYFKEKGLI